MDENKTTTLTDEQVEEISKVIEDVAEDSENISNLRDIQESDREIDPEDVKSETAYVVTDPITGNITGSIPADYDSDKDIMDMTFEDILNDPNIDGSLGDPKKVNLNPEVISEALKLEYPDFNMNEFTELMKVLERYKNGEKFPYFASLPAGFRNKLNASIPLDIVSKAGSLLKGAQNEAAEEFLRYLVDENFLQQTSIDLNNAIANEMDKVKDVIKQPITEYNQKVREHFETYYAEMADKIEEKDAEKAALLRKVSTAYTEAYTYTPLIEKMKSGKLKVKSIQVDKFQRTCNEFNRKYQDSTLVCKDIAMIPPIVYRHTKDRFDEDMPEIARQRYIKAFVCTFVNYTKFMKPSNLDEHTFMYYFISNITQLDFYDQNSESETEFMNNLLDNIWTIIKYHIDLDAAKREEAKAKKGAK